MRHRAVVSSEDKNALAHLHDHLYEHMVLDDLGVDWVGPDDQFPDGRIREGEPGVHWLEQVALDGGGTTCYRRDEERGRTFRVTVEEVEG